MRRSHGFLEEAVKEIAMRPGQSATDIAKRLLADGRATSMAKNPVGSLLATLHKYHSEKPVLRRWEAGEYRYYPDSESEEAESHPPQPAAGSCLSDAFLLGLPKDCLEYVNALAILPQFSTSRDAVIWLLRKGMQSTRVS